MRENLLIFVIGAIFIAIIFFACGKKESSKRNFSLAVWAEFLPYEEYEKIYDKLQKLDVELFLAIREGDFPHPSLQKIKYRAWLLLKKEKGYWLSVRNAEDFFKLVKDFLNLYKSEWIALDFEPPYEFATKITENFFESLSEIIPPEEVYINGKAKIEEIVKFSHEKGAKVLCVFPNFVLDDLVQKSENFQKMLGIPVPKDCDEYSFMIYSTIIKGLAEKILKLKIDFPEYIVWDYGKDAFHIFGDKSALSIGLVGKDSFGNEGYKDVEGLIKDISAGLAVGIKKFHIWTVDNMKDENGNWQIEKWLDISYVSPISPPEDSGLKNLREFLLSIAKSKVE